MAEIIPLHGARRKIEPTHIQRAVGGYALTPEEHARLRADLVREGDYVWNELTAFNRRVDHVGNCPQWLTVASKWFIVAMLLLSVAVVEFGL